MTPSSSDGRAEGRAPVISTGALVGSDQLELICAMPNCGTPTGTTVVLCSEHLAAYDRGIPERLETVMLGITVSIGSWHFTVHRRSCAAYLRSFYVDRPVSPGMPLKVCKACRPTEAEVDAYLPSIGVYIYSHGGLGKLRAGPPPETVAGARVIGPLELEAGS